MRTSNTTGPVALSKSRAAASWFLPTVRGRGRGAGETPTAGGAGYPGGGPWSVAGPVAAGPGRPRLNPTPRGGGPSPHAVAIANAFVAQQPPPQIAFEIATAVAERL